MSLLIAMRDGRPRAPLHLRLSPLLLTWSWLGSPPAVHPQDPPFPSAPPLLAPSGPANTTTTDSASSRELEAIARSLLLTYLPRDYENVRDWGGTKPVWNGLHVSRDGLQIKTKRRWKEVNHGTWTRYRAWLIDPDRELQIRFANLRRAGTHQLATEMTLDARLGATGRLSEWNRGVQLYSFHADANARVQLQVSCEVSLQFDTGRLPPDIQLVPRVTDARLILREFHLERISSADGPLVQRLGDALRNDIERELNERREKLVEKLNRSLEKNSDRLRLSIHELAASGWDRLIALPAR